MSRISAALQVISQDRKNFADLLWVHLENQVVQAINNGQVKLTIAAVDLLTLAGLPLDNETRSSLVKCIPAIRELAMNDGCIDLILKQNDIHVEWKA